MDFFKLYLMIISSITFGYLIAAISVETGFINWLGLKTVKFSKLGIHPLLSPIPVLYLVSPRAAHLHASELLKKGKIKPKDIYIAAAASNFPMRITFLYRYYFPVLIPLIGYLAVYYGLLRLAFDTIILIAVLIIGKRLYKNTKHSDEKIEKVNIIFNFQTLKKGVINGIKESLKFIVKFSPLFIFIIYLISKGIMAKMLTVMSPVLKWIGLDDLEATYVATAAISPPVAYGLIKIMLAKHYPTTKILGTMFLGNAIFTFLRAWWAYVLPYYYGLYPLNVTFMLISIQSFMPATYNLLMGILLSRI
ncbi:hypothetical protein BLW93_01795 [Desulfurobacterium indicum]|uniref:Nucleoside recognition protein n=1 Tax=Desulfurobacterium indicum TaxID=1914305 RepID=A0A1R1MMR8_9BACT|nr:hypothetical protein BLW93_01795 [Desulfurobacterium indicum]